MIYVGVSRAIGFVPFAWLIMLVLRVKFSHTYIRFFDDYTKEWLIFEASHGEVHLIHVDNWKTKNKAVTERGYDISSDRKKELVRFMIRNLQVKYSVANIVGLSIHALTGIKLLRDKDKGFICSELVAKALGDKFESSFDKPLDYVTPKDIYERAIK